MPDVLEQDALEIDTQLGVDDEPATQPDIDPAEPAEPPEPEPEPKPDVPPAVLELMQRQQDTIEALRKASEPKPEAPPGLSEFLEQNGIDEGSRKFFEIYEQWRSQADKGKFLERDYGHLLHHVASVTDQQAALDAVKRGMKATDAELAGLSPHLQAVRQEYGNLPTKAAHELALTRMRGSKTATGLSSARAAKQEGLNKLTPPTKGGGPKLAAAKLSDEEYEKLTPLQRTAVLNGMDPATFAGM